MSSGCRSGRQGIIDSLLPLVRHAPDHRHCQEEQESNTQQGHGGRFRNLHKREGDIGELISRGVKEQKPAEGYIGVRFSSAFRRGCKSPHTERSDLRQAERERYRLGKSERFSGTTGCMNAVADAAEPPSRISLPSPAIPEKQGKKNP